MKAFDFNKFIITSFFYISCKSTVPIIDIDIINNDGDINDIDNWLTELS